MTSLAPTPGLNRYAPRVPPATALTDETCALLQENVPVRRRIVREGDRVYQVGQQLESLHIVHSGSFKTVGLTADGREQMLGLHMKGDWLGFDAIARGCHTCDAMAMDIGEVWSVPYAALLQACARQPELTALMHAAMSREITRERNAMMALCSLPAHERVADFLRMWLEELGEHVIGFPEKGRRHVSISDADALARFVQRGLAN